ncbi:gasdermin-A [Colius striatus]|uniref:gasdermin-A n=1 Tax=Colius striatus TaxID=57412 RepID=UPI002B1D2A3A|nr:gasdermin-A [Colius striatus]XP_061874152.1 gasdermin-A [Colius striatus]
MFKKITQCIAKQMDPRGDLVPVHSIMDHEHFRPLCLVRRKKAMFHSSPCYRQTWYRLEDVLLPGEEDKSIESLFSHGDGQDLRQFTVKKIISDRIDGSLSLAVDSASVELKGAASLSHGWTIKLEKNHIPVPKLEALKTERKINTNHSFIQQLLRTDQNLYVVHETIETSEETSFEESTTAEGSFMTQLYAKFSAKGSRESRQSITIPKGCTLAFRAIQLNIKDVSWDFLYFRRCCLTIVSDGFSQGKVSALEADVTENCKVLSTLSSDLFIMFLNTIKAVMRDRNLFQELTRKMEAVLDGSGSCELKTESPDLKELLSSLQHSSRDLLLTLAGAITYTLDALDELMEDQLLLLLESLEKKIVSQQLKLVKSILEQDMGQGRFSVAASLLAFSQEEEQNLTIAMVEMSGVRLEKDGSAASKAGAFSAVAALYVSLYILNLLSNSD